MRQIALLTLLLLFGLFGAACGTAAPAAPSPQPASGTVAAQAPAAAGDSTQVDVTLADNTITSSLATFKAGVPYTFVIKNNGNHLHNFNIAQPVSVTGSLDASLSGALVTVTQDKLPLGGGTTIQYTFPDSAVGMPLEFSCLIKRHYEDGMRLAITVTK
jgi:uncharacterized cupredoxin-like copper-binding protein